jgi:hypothetical protein
MMVEEIATELLVAHPENANHMSGDVLRKLRSHLERSGRYEPLVVRPYPQLPGRFQLLNGHHRFRVLKELGHNSVRCLVWDVDDDQARLYLATLNRLSGKDIPERRAALIENLLGAFDLDDLDELLPDGKRQIEAVERLIRADLGDLAAHTEQLRGDDLLPVIIDFVVDQEGNRQIHLALDMFRVAHGQAISNGEALVGLAAFFLERCSPGN